MTTMASPILVSGNMENLVIFIDPERCMGCRSCELACAVEHSLSKLLYGAIFEKPLPRPRIRVVTVDNLLYVPMRCQHCKDAPCMNVCPTKALQRTPEGYVVLSPEKCIGCIMCVLACPFGHPRYNPDTKTIIKCDFCVDRIREGRLPACVEACPTGALRFGRLEEFLEELSTMKAKELVSGRPTAPGIVVVKPVSEVTPTPKPLDIKSKYSPVSWG